MPQILQIERNSCHQSGTVYGKVVEKNPSAVKWQRDMKKSFDTRIIEAFLSASTEEWWGRSDGSAEH